MKNILVIEDDDHFRFIVCKFLRENNFHVIEAENALTGIQLSQEQYPDLIICDLDLPDRNGYQILEKLQVDSTNGKIPFTAVPAVMKYILSRGEAFRQMIYW